MLTNEAKQELEHQQYRLVGEHSAVKVCGWTKNMIRGKGGCYKLKFYGIMSHQCLQMTTSLSCANRCVFCWRGYKAPVSKEWNTNVDDPEGILQGSITAHHKLLVGFAGSDSKNEKLYEESKKAKHVALSLTGEPIIYPKINQFIKLCDKEGISTFLVTNGQYPQAIKDLAPVTQLYLSLDAPDEKLLREIDVPLFKDYWERMLQSLDALKEKKQRTCIRITVIKGMNDLLPEKYAELIERGNPDFIEVKSYMHVGASQQRLKRENMPLHEEIVQFSEKLLPHLPDYEIVSEHVPSRVVLLARKKYKKKDGWYTWINFRKWKQLVNSGNEFLVEEYWERIPAVGLSGKGTVDEMELF